MFSPRNLRMVFRFRLLKLANNHGFRSIHSESTQTPTLTKSNLVPEVKEISREFIKPSSPTPSHLRTYTLSLLEQTHPPNHLPILLFYPRPSPTAAFDITTIKHSLAETLSRFYPLAGRLKDESTVTCTDEGIPFIQTRVSCLLSNVVDSTPDKLLGITNSLLPPRDLVSEQRPISEMLSLPIQINVFDCGGVVIGCYMLHKLLDGVSLGTFFAYWAAHAAQRYNDLVDPDLSSGLRLFPPCSNLERLFEPTNLQVSPADDDPADDVLPGPVDVVVAKSFVFSRAAITELKTKATSADLLVRDPTSFEAVAAFVWEQAAAAAADTTPAIRGNKPTALLFSSNMRGKINPPLAKGAIGNLVVAVEAKSKNWGGMAELVAEIREALSTVKDRAEEFQGRNGTEAFLTYLQALMPKYIGFQPGSYMLTSLCKLSLEDADFGFGKPKRIMVIPVDDDGKVDFRFRNSIIFSTHFESTSDGIEAWLILEKKEMEILESNPHFLAFATPN